MREFPALALLGALANLQVVLDAVKRTPGLFEVLRPLIDEKRTPGWPRAGYGWQSGGPPIARWPVSGHANVATLVVASGKRKPAVGGLLGCITRVGRAEWLQFLASAKYSLVYRGEMASVVANVGISTCLPDPPLRTLASRATMLKAVCRLTEKSTTGTPASPVTLITSVLAWMVRSNPPSPPRGPSWP